jgi:ribonuclease HI
MFRSERHTEYLDIPIWNMLVLKFVYDLRVGKKSEVCPTDFQNHFHVIQDIYNDHLFIYTDGSKDDNKVGCTAVFGRPFIKEQLPDAASIYSAELEKIYLAARHIVDSQKSNFVICLYSMSCVQAIENLDIDHPIVLDIFNLFHTHGTQKKYLVLCWVPSHFGIRGNEFAEKIVKLALTDQPKSIKLPYSDYIVIFQNLFAKEVVEHLVCTTCQQVVFCATISRNLAIVQ